MSRTVAGLDPFIKAALGFDPATPDATVRREWARRTKNVCKPCWELKYCPYGPLVEQFPLLDVTRAEAVAHNEFLKEQLAAGAYDGKKRREFSKQVANFEPSDYPVAHDRRDVEKSCSVFAISAPSFS